MAGAVGFDLGDTLIEYEGVALDWQREYPAALAALASVVGSRLTSDRVAAGTEVLDPGTGKLVDGGVADQAARVFDNLEAVLSAASLTMDDVIKCNVFLTTMDDFAAMNDVYGQRFRSPFPARSTVAVAGLPLGARVEIELVARRP